MNRWISILTVALVCLCGCVTTHTYLSYEIVRELDQVKVGDEVRVVLKTGDTVQGTVLRVRESALMIASREQGERSISWEDIQVAERVSKAKVKEY